MYERFTERARQVVVLAQDEARDLMHDYIGTEHILLGLLREEDGLAARILESLHVYDGNVRLFILKKSGKGKEVTTGQIPFTPRAKKILELALREALSLGHNYIGTEHVLLGLVRDDGGLAYEFLTAQGVTPQDIRDEVLRMLSGPGKKKVTIGSHENNAVVDEDDFRQQYKVLLAQHNELRADYEALQAKSDILVLSGSILQAAQIIADALKDNK